MLDKSKVHTVINTDKWEHYLQQDHVNSDDYPHQAFLPLPAHKSLSKSDATFTRVPADSLPKIIYRIAHCTFYLLNNAHEGPSRSERDVAPSLVGVVEILCSKRSHRYTPMSPRSSSSSGCIEMRILTSVLIILTRPAFLCTAEVEYNYPQIM
ncbi:hypothetical protein MJO28_005369 [Puccinia striiformis f. sp. tritici]|uniref:Uncharacterized protein n=1 Tax=Puccinia striiformis f. sp. tritici TaxID=168172 RepID=A0ACC0ELI2_9BASI|nr:hypothetical protein MJO28_005369 [Puccinia striiformis f. sp. tritici]